MNQDQNQDQKKIEETPITPAAASGPHAGVFFGLAAGLVVALAGDAYLVVRSNDLNAQLLETRKDAQTQMARLGETTTGMLEQERQQIQALSDDVTGKYADANSAVLRARQDALKAASRLAAKLDAEQKAVGEQIAEVKEASNTATAKLNDDVSGVKTDVGTVRSDLATTRTDLDRTGADLKRAVGDMGVLSGLIATNSKDLQALRELGERNYFEFTLKKGEMTKKIGGLTLTLKKSDPKHNRYTMTVLVDDHLVEKKDRTINEPVQLYGGNSRQPYEIVVNTVQKDGVAGYLAAPKVNLARR